MLVYLDDIEIHQIFILSNIDNKNKSDDKYKKGPLTIGGLVKLNSALE